MDEALQFDFDWLQIRHRVKEILNLEKLPDLNAILLFIGVQELGRWKSAKFKKKKSRTSCTLLSVR
jgi:hypothetical protein